jgi:hypothetical protein
MENWNIQFTINEIRREIPQQAQFVTIEHPKNGVKVKEMADPAYA